MKLQRHWKIKGNKLSEGSSQQVHNSSKNGRNILAVHLWIYQSTDKI